MPDPQPTILLVDDDQDLRNLLERVLLRSGMAVHPAGDGRQAIKLLARQKFDLVVTDIIMPGDWTGQRLAGELRRQRPGLGVILMSGYGPGRLEETGGTASTGTFLAKPYSIRALKESVEQQLACIGTDTVAN